MLHPENLGEKSLPCPISGGPRSSLACPATPQSMPTPSHLLSLCVSPIRTLVTGFRVRPDNPGHSHPQVNHIFRDSFSKSSHSPDSGLWIHFVGEPPFDPLHTLKQSPFLTHRSCRLYVVRLFKWQKPVFTERLQAPPSSPSSPYRGPLPPTRTFLAAATAPPSEPES